MIFAPAAAHPYTPVPNLPTEYKHYTTNSDFCSTAKDTCGTCRHLPTTADPSKEISRQIFGTLDSLSSTAIHPFRPRGNSWAAEQPYKTHDHLPAD